MACALQLACCCLPRLALRPRPAPLQRVAAAASSLPAHPEDPQDKNSNSAMQDQEQVELKGKNNLRSKMAALGLSAVLAYGLLDGITYTSFFALAFLGYEKSTGKNPAANLKALLGIVVLMWTGNNVTRPFRVAGAAALAPVLDRFLVKLQKSLRLPNKALAFLLTAVCFASLCLSVAGLLILSRWAK